MKKFYSIALALFVVFGFASFASAQDTLTYNLKLGMRNDPQVVAMQNFLISQNYLAPTNNTGFFGQLTFAAVRIYQSENSIDSTGFVGPLTRGSMNRAISNGGSSVSTTYLPGCTSYVGYSATTGALCATAQNNNQGGQTLGLMLSPVQVTYASATSVNVASSFTAQTNSYYTVRFEYANNLASFSSSTQARIGQIVLSGQSGSFSASLGNLVPGQSYYVRAVAEGGTYGTVTTPIVSFVANSSTSTYVPPVVPYQNQNTAQYGQAYVGTGSATSVNENSALVSGVYDGRGADTTVAFQYWYGISAISTTPLTSGGTGSGTASVTLSNLNPGTTYSFRIIGVNAYGTAYGSTGTFTTIAQTQPITPGSTNTVVSCPSGTIPHVTATRDSSSFNGTIANGQSNVSLATFRIATDCYASLKSFTFGSNPSSAWNSFSGYSVYIGGSSYASAGSFSGATFTPISPVFLGEGTSTTVTLKGNTPTSGTNSSQFNLVSVTAQSSGGTTSQYSTPVSGNTLYPTLSGNPGGPIGGTNTGTTSGATTTTQGSH